MTLQQHWPAPTRARPIMLIGAGGVVRDGHLPAYRIQHLKVDGIFDAVPERAAELAAQFKIRAAYPTLRSAITEFDTKAVYDVAVPPQQLIEVLEQLPNDSAVLLQKPLGMSLAEATAIIRLCRQKNLRAAVNFQLRFAPAMLALRDIIRGGRIGHPLDIEVRLHCETPWKQWPALVGLSRIEIPLHSVHYLDLLRSLFGEPIGVSASTLAHPAAPGLASTRSTIILDYGQHVQCTIRTNHHHRWGTKFACSELRVEGTLGAAVVRMGVNLAFPHGQPDTLWFVQGDGEAWEEVSLEGSWYPHGFRGPMCNLQRFVVGEDPGLWTGVDDAWRTMALVEACYAPEAHVRAHPRHGAEAKPESAAAARGQTAV